MSGPRSKKIQLEVLEEEKGSAVNVEIEEEELVLPESTVLEEKSYPPKAYPTVNQSIVPVPAYNPYALMPYGSANIGMVNSTLPSSIKQQVKTSDDSNTAYGEQYASTFGFKKFAPLSTEPSAPPLEDKDWEEYQAWMNAPSFAERQAFPQHKRWADLLNENQDFYRLDPSIAFKDSISEKFRHDTAKDKRSSLLFGHGLPPKLAAVMPFQPVKFEAQLTASSSSASVASRYIDQVQEMMDYADEQYHTSYFKGKFTGQRIASNHFYVVSDHAGNVSGKKLQIWGAGVKDSFNVASANTKQSLGKVEGSADFYESTTDYAHVANRFTIIRINDNEMGFVLNRAANRVEKMQMGRYVIPESEYAYIGKTLLQASNQALSVPAHSTGDPNIVHLAAQLQVVWVLPGQTAFVKDNHNTYMLPANPDEAYILDRRRGEQFINVENTNQQVLRATDGSYTHINQLRPGEFVVFQHHGQMLCWPYDAYHSELNTLFLRANEFLSDNVVHNTNENLVQWQGINVVNTLPGQVAVVQNPDREIRFIENIKATSFVLRTPWLFLGFTSQNQNHYSAGSQSIGNQTSRLVLRSSEWAAVLGQNGHLSFYPPRLDNKPYYFSQPEHTVVGIVDKNKPCRQDLEVPGIGLVSVVNIPSGQIGSCRMRNMHFFLNPSPNPYIFMPPDEFVGLVDAKASHTSNGDLHRIVLAPDEQAVIIKDGELHRLPADGSQLSGQNGVYVFRATQFSFEEGGPKKKSEKNCKLGPIHSFIVNVGEKGYGTVDGKLKIWEVGQHYVDNRKNEWFTNFFDTNVDPVNIGKLPVTFKHGISGEIDVFVSYHIDNPEKAIDQFKDHKILHQFIHTTTSSEMLKLCASRPPLGYTDLDFSGNQRNSVTTANTDITASEAVKELQDSFMRYANTLKEKYGVSISDMYIHTWTLAEDFVKQVQENAKSLQNAHADVARTQIALQKAALENQQAQQQQENLIALKRLENQRLELTLAGDCLQQENEAKIQGARRLAEANANAAIKGLDAKAMVESAEQNALAKSAEERANSRALAEIAINKLAAKKAETDAKLLETSAEKSEGEMRAQVAALKEQARFAGLDSTQRVELQLAEIRMQNLTMLVGMLAKANLPMPGVFELNRDVFAAYQAPAIAAAQQQSAQRNMAGTLGLFGLQSQQPILSTAPVLTTPLSSTAEVKMV